MKFVIEILKKMKKFHETLKYLGMHLEEFVEKLVRNLRKIKNKFWKFLENFERFRTQKLEILSKI